ncbi:dihydrofolate reductase family protein [Actinomadura verrucosospora]
MRRIVAELFSTLDGVVEGPETWHGPHHDDEVDRAVMAGMDEADALLVGRRTYEDHAAYWPTADGAMAERMNAFRKYVVTSSDAPLEWANTEPLPGLDEVAGLDGTLLVTGSPTLVRGLLARGLLDELRLVIDPIAAGSGGRLFDAPVSFERAASRAFPSGSVSITYRPVR